ncbi:hypothetical protein PVL29_006001 [Vitis rotundifolia]|uniref:40S ribosomal protein SA n=1 Tax=Vitis rotundifolia TaxID=103349 RepID=A0AA39A3V0_VITRO|nr:hypothetical protein PVL29_006001 [Vitis rotundifolia]
MRHSSGTRGGMVLLFAHVTTAEGSFEVCSVHWCLCNCWKAYIRHIHQSVPDIFRSARLLILTDPRTEHQHIKEAALGNVPIVAFCDIDSPMQYVDIDTPTNNKGKHTIGRLFWLLARMVLQIRCTIAPGRKWDVMMDPFFYREPEESKEQEGNEVIAAPDYRLADY